MTEVKPKRKGIPKPEKPPIQRLDDHQKIDPDIGPSQTRMIGKVATVWATLEALMHEVIWELTGLGIEDGRILTTRQGADWQINVLRALAQRHISNEGHPSERHKFLDVLDIINHRREDRNTIVHGTWATIDGEPHVSSFKMGTPDLSRVTTESYSWDRMRQIVEELRQCGVYLSLFMVRHRASREIATTPPAAMTPTPPP